MNLLLDTHIFLWIIWNSPRLPENAKDAFLNPDNTLHFSAVSYWEICIKYSIGRLELQSNWQKVFDRELAYNGIRWLAVKKEHCQGITNLPHHHSDPFDRLLIAQAMHEQFTLVTADSTIAQYNVAIL